MVFLAWFKEARVGGSGLGQVICPREILPPPPKYQNGVVPKMHFTEFLGLALVRNVTDTQNSLTIVWPIPIAELWAHTFHGFGSNEVDVLDYIDFFCVEASLPRCAATAPISSRSMDGWTTSTTSGEGGAV